MAPYEIADDLRGRTLDAEETAMLIGAVLRANQRSRDKVSLAWAQSLVTAVVS